ncbi:MAG: bifunctional ornithine acetyltransferase/N-acetylglutamate synthase, partial [Proteobacteria bacterium]|nr:bifunctional ornithine acetyltransferase/N-acetylglutamate synthase [Pseudomonadota bacterium]
MPVNLPTPEKADLLAVAGIKLGISSAGIKTAGKEDLVLIELAESTVTSAVYTQNAFCAAPVTLAKQHQQQISPRYLLINSGNANAGTGEAGMQAAQACCQSVADLTDAEPTSVLPFSTGVIGQQLPVEKIQAALPAA